MVKRENITQTADKKHTIQYFKKTLQNIANKNGHHVYN